MLSSGLPEAVLHGVTFQNGMVHGIVYSHFCKWRDDGTLYTLFCALNTDADYENLSIDSTIIRVHQHGTGAKKGFEQ